MENHRSVTHRFFLFWPWPSTEVNYEMDHLRFDRFLFSKGMEWLQSLTPKMENKIEEVEFSYNILH